ncbi:MAG TPA: hypothetical protein GX520_05120 [Syntrophaceticus sp.]|jgi:hypothetical protein|uniref:Uncharacterized protein n=1 Tax=Syntrophaceticus schinkii TaxID=499207 RepID=A0A0B7MKJ1_9FIRM|nr:hypothetical protein [Syntrophaceticus schinkii]HHY30063.1 hypothetical protein [Syntrophaceticus sp.]MDD2358899.1 hypothetical protein [Syntrophaceticus schinkii]MDD4262241.1 hypothetical protein [Syntrophaceticus schinkii]MDD4674087.1 hypothetical protein [Syntrophaceticus schinkii]CEO88172.1 membrane hypothetical protein [Syntrophaceticus schinkii]
MRACFWNKAAFTIFMNVGQYLTLPHYILNYHDYVIQAALLVPALLLATFLFFFLGIALFERNPLERSGQLLVFGDTRKVIQVVASLFIAVVVTIAVGEFFTTLRGFTLLLVLLGAYFLCSGFIKWRCGDGVRLE